MDKKFGNVRNCAFKSESNDVNVVGDIPKQKGNVGRRGLGVKNRGRMHLSLI
jgi:hypothetical protein